MRLPPQHVSAPLCHLQGVCLVISPLKARSVNDWDSVAFLVSVLYGLVTCSKEGITLKTGNYVFDYVLKTIGKEDASRIHTLCCSTCACF